jgi:hypothetical protein
MSKRQQSEFFSRKASEGDVGSWRRKDPANTASVTHNGGGVPVVGSPPGLKSRSSGRRDTKSNPYSEVQQQLKIRVQAPDKKQDPPRVKTDWATPSSSPTPPSPKQRQPTLSSTPSQSPRSDASSTASTGRSMNRSESWTKMAQMFAEEADASSDEEPAPRRAQAPKAKKLKRAEKKSGTGIVRSGSPPVQSASPRGSLSPSFGPKNAPGKRPLLQARTASVLPVSPNSRLQKKQDRKERKEPQQQQQQQQNTNNKKGKQREKGKAKPPNALAEQQQHQQQAQPTPSLPQEKGWDLVRAPAKGQKLGAVPRQQQQQQKQQRASSTTRGGGEDVGRDALQAAFLDTDMSLAVLAPKGKTRSGSGKTLSKKEQEDKLRAREALAQLSQAKQERKRKKKLQKQEQREQNMLEQIKRRREAAVNAQETASGARTSVHSRHRSRRGGKKLADAERYWKERRDTKAREVEAEQRRFMLKMALLSVCVFVLSVWALGPVGFGSVAVLAGMSMVAVASAYYMSRCCMSVYLSIT